MAQVASAQQFPFVWEGTDKKGKRIKGKMLAVSEAAVKADLRRQGVLAKRVRKESQLFKSGKKIVSEDIQRIILQEGNAVDIAAQAAAEGIWDLRRSGLEKAKTGITSLDEVNQCTVE